jgi:hypothetical protein
LIQEKQYALTLQQIYDTMRQLQSISINVLFVLQIIDKTSPKDAILVQWKKMMLKYHPDKHSSKIEKDITTYISQLLVHERDEYLQARAVQS